MIGLGVGSLAAYAEKDQSYTFYEIDPTVRWAAESSGDFSYLADVHDAGRTVRIVMGDAHLDAGERRARSFARSARPRRLQRRFGPAPSADARGAGDVFRKLKPTGLLAVHISNLYLDLSPVLANLAADAGCAAWKNDDLELTPVQAWQGKLASQWMLIAPASRRESVQSWAKETGWIAAPAPTRQSGLDG